MSSPIISVCIPVYNVEPYLPQCLDSIANQTFTDFEVIIVNDASPDNSEAIIKSYQKKDSRIRYYKHKKNQGLAATRKTAIDHAHGDYISFVDSDDWVEPTFLAKLYEKATATQADVTICNILLYYHKDYHKIALNLEQDFLPPYFVHQSATRISPSYCNKLWKKKLFHQPEVEFINIHWGEDLLVCSKLLYYSKKISIVTEALYYYRVDYTKHNSSKTKAQREQLLIKQLSGEHVIHKNLLDFFRKRGYQYAIQELLAQRTEQFWFYVSEIIVLRSTQAKKLLLQLVSKYHGHGSYKPISLTHLWLNGLLILTLNTILPSKLFIQLKRIYVKLKKTGAGNSKPTIHSELFFKTNSKKPVISVGIPVHNCQLFITKCLDSVINQTLKNIEIIVVDDCSTDNSFAILTEYEKKDSRFKIIRHTHNQGANAARKTALDNATAEYLIFIDGDDWIHPTMLEQLYQHSNDGEKDIVICGLALVYDKNLSIPYVNLKPHTIKTFNQNSLHIFPEGTNPGFTNKIWKTKLFHQPGIEFLNIPFGEDLAVTCKLFFYARDIAFVNEVLYYYRLDHKTPMPQKPKAEQEQKLLQCLEGEFTLYENLLTFFTPHGLSQQIITLLGKRSYWFYNYLQKISQCKSIRGLDLLAKLIKKYHGKTSAYSINFTLLKWKSSFWVQLKHIVPTKIYYLLLAGYIKYLK